MKSFIELERQRVANSILSQYSKILLDDTGIDITQKGRKRDKVDLTRIFCKYVRYNLGFSSTRIATFLNKTHASILHAANTYDHLYFRELNFRELADFYITRFAAIDGVEIEEPNHSDLMTLISCASEKTKGIWLKLIQDTEMLRGIATNIELVENE